MQVADIMTENPKACRPDDSAEEALHHMDECECGAVPVVDKDGRAIGIVTDRDILFGIRQNGGRLEKLTVEACMTKDPVTLRRNTTAEDAVRTLAENRIRRAPVVDPDGKLVGIVAQADVATHVGDDRLIASYLREVSIAPSIEPAPER